MKFAEQQHEFFDPFPPDCSLFPTLKSEPNKLD